MKRFKALLATSFLLVTTASFSLSASPLAPVELWPDGAPETVTFEQPEYDKTTAKDDLVDGRYVTRLTNVTNPTLTFYPAPAANNTGTTILVCPGGGYWILAYDLEGTEICEWLNSIGVNAALLKYRVPKREGREKWAVALEDAARSMQIIRSKSREWNIDPNKVGVLGFSAGGHLSATVSNLTEMPEIEGYASIDGVKVQPDFTVLIYPAYLADPENNYQIQPEVQPTKKTPPTFIAMAMDDPVGIRKILHYSLALKEVEVPASVHIYPTGGHGYGLRKTQNPVTSWPDRVEEWMQYSGFLK